MEKENSELSVWHKNKYSVIYWKNIYLHVREEQVFWKIVP